MSIQQPEIFTGTRSMFALSRFGLDPIRPWQATCSVCGYFHVAAADEGQARHLVLTHIDQDHQLVDVWKAGEL